MSQQPPYPPQGYPQQPQGYPQQPPQGYPQPPNAPAPKRKGFFRRHKIATAFWSVVALFILIVAIGASGGSKSPGSSGNTTLTEPSVSAPTTAAPAKPSAKPSPAFKPHTVATFSGSGQETTPRFTVPATWKLEYSYNCSNFGGSGNFAVSEDGGNDFNGVNVNELTAGRSGSSWVYQDAGTHSLQIISECSWSAKVVAEGN